MPTIATDGGRPVDVTPDDDAAVKAEFQQTIHDPGPDEKQVPKRQEKAPAEDPKPRRGRAPKAEQPRTVDKAAAVVKDDYSKDARDFVGMTWTALAAVPATQPYALVVNVNADPLAAALAEGAKHSKTIRSFVASGSSSWMLALAGVGFNMGMQAWQIAKDPELQARARAATAEQFAKALGAKGIEVPEPAHVPAAA